MKLWDKQYRVNFEDLKGMKPHVLPILPESRTFSIMPVTENLLALSSGCLLL